MAEDPAEGAAIDDQEPRATSWWLAGVLAVLMGGPALWFSIPKTFSDSPEIEACENYVLGGLRSPSTYGRVSIESMKVDGQLWVTLVYDAANAYGAPVRETETCKFRIENGLPVVPHVMDPNSDLAIAIRQLDERSGSKREPCCLD